MSKPEGYKSVHLYFPPDFHKKLKVAVALKETTIRKYIMSLVEDDLDKIRTSSRVALKEASGAGG